MKALLSHTLVIVVTAATTTWLLNSKPWSPAKPVVPAATAPKARTASPPVTEANPGVKPTSGTPGPNQLELENEWLQTIIDQLELENQQLKQQLRATELARGGKAGPTQNTWFDEDALLEAGLNKRDFADLQQRVEELELRKLETTNQATREGWVRKKEYYQQMRDLEQAFRESLGPTEYDIYLYATGKPNRVAVSDVLENSAAGLGGIRSGDIILTYAGEPIYDPSALYRMTTQGEVGEMVPITLQRGDDTVVSYLPRGPLGTRFRAQRQPPTAP